MPARRTSSPGYTLVELVIVMLLLGMIAIACESGLHFGTQVWAHTEAATHPEARLISAQSVLQTLLAHVLPRAKSDAITFDGEAMAMSFDLVPPQAFESGTAHASLRIVQGRNDTRLELELQSIMAPSIKKRAVLLDDAGQMRFAYLDTSGQSHTWLGYWRDRNRLPAAIRITGNDPTRWPTLIVRPILVQSATCILDLEELACRKI
jgi:prepilin-type N-terminal cleavage/methylation domain-containing protein